MIKLSRGPACLVPAANRYQRHQRIAYQHFIGVSQRISARCDFDNAKRRLCQLRDTMLTHNAIDSGMIETWRKHIHPLAPEQICGTAFRKPPVAVKNQRLIGVRLLKMRPDQHLLQSVQMLQPGQQWITPQANRA